jgi:hypothetical protein
MHALLSANSSLLFVVQLATLIDAKMAVEAVVVEEKFKALMTPRV